MNSYGTQPVAHFKLSEGVSVYGRFKPATAIESPKDFLITTLPELVNAAAQTISWRGDGAVELVNTAIQIVEESFVVLEIDEQLEQKLCVIAECSIAFLKASETKVEREVLLRLGEALGQYGAALAKAYGPVAMTANLKLVVLSRLLLVNCMRPILDTAGKNTEIDFQRLGRIRGMTHPLA